MQLIKSLIEHQDNQSIVSELITEAIGDYLSSNVAVISQAVGELENDGSTKIDLARKLNADELMRAFTLAYAVAYRFDDYLIPHFIGNLEQHDPEKEDTLIGKAPANRRIFDMLRFMTKDAGRSNKVYTQFSRLIHDKFGVEVVDTKQITRELSDEKVSFSYGKKNETVSVESAVNGLLTSKDVATRVFCGRFLLSLNQKAQKVNATLAARIGNAGIEAALMPNAK